MSLIYESLCRVIADIEAIGKDRRNEMQKFNFRGIDDVMNAVHPLFAKHGVFCTPLVKHDNTDILETKNGGSATSVRLNCHYKFFAKDGSFVECEVPGEGRDSGDKATNKALSMAYKYVILQMLCIPTEETAAMDPDMTTPEDVKPAAKNDSNKPSKTPSTRKPFDEQKAAETVHMAIKAIELSSLVGADTGKGKLRGIGDLLELAQQRIKENVWRRSHYDQVKKAAVKRYIVLLNEACAECETRQAVMEVQEHFYGHLGNNLLDDELRELDAEVDRIKATMPS